MITLTADAPVPINLAERIPITSEACLHFINQNIKTLCKANFLMLGVGVIYIYGSPAEFVGKKRPFWSS